MPSHRQRHKNVVVAPGLTAASMRAALAGEAQSRLLVAPDAALSDVARAVCYAREQGAAVEVVVELAALVDPPSRLAGVIAAAGAQGLTLVGTVEEGFAAALRRRCPAVSKLRLTIAPPAPSRARPAERTAEPAPERTAKRGPRAHRSLVSALVGDLDLVELREGEA